MKHVSKVRKLYRGFRRWDRRTGKRYTKFLLRHPVKGAFAGAGLGLVSSLGAAAALTLNRRTRPVGQLMALLSPAAAAGGGVGTYLGSKLQASARRHGKITGYPGFFGGGNVKRHGLAKFLSRRIG